LQVTTTTVIAQGSNTNSYTVSSTALDGRTHTLTTTGKNAQGEVVDNVVVYEKQ